jgi:YD repeat-containing protein
MRSSNTPLLHGQISDDKAYDFASAPGVLAACTFLTPTVPTTPTPDRETTRGLQRFANPYAVSLGATGLNAMYFGMPSGVAEYGNGTKMSETDYWFDQTSLADPGAVNHDSANFPAGVVSGRGNMTTATKVCLSNCSGNLVTTATYDVAGQVLSVTDPCGNSVCGDMTGSAHTTSYSYANNYSDATPSSPTDAYLTQVTYPTVQGITQHRYYHYRYSDGQVTFAQDDNDKNAGASTGISYQYADPLNRLTQTCYPDGGITNLSYPDPDLTTSKLVYYGTRPTPCTTTGGTWMKSTAMPDGLGQVTETQLTTDPDGTDYTFTTFYGSGQVYQQGIPNRSGNPGAHATFYYDPLGRKIKMVDSDGSSVQWWCYNGVQSTLSGAAQPTSMCNQALGSQAGKGGWVDRQDENGNDWQSLSNSFGNLLQMMEPNGVTASPTMETDYAYDALDNLTSVKQWGGVNGASGSRTRSFTYDSFSRVVQSNNSETGSVCYGIVGGSNCISGYDANGNLAAKTDARGVVVHYTYDPLNRLLSKTYAYDLSGTPSSCFEYDTPPGGSSSNYQIGRLANEWTQRGACPAAPGSGYLTLRAFTSYDLMGRALGEKQCTPSNCTATKYALAHTYDQAGDVSSTTYPSGMVLAQSFSGADRLQSISNSGASLFSTSSPPSGPCGATGGYAPFGSLTNAYLGATGNSFTLSRNYDTRLRITCEQDTGTAVSSATGGSATVTISGWEQSK